MYCARQLILALFIINNITCGITAIIETIPQEEIIHDKTPRHELVKLLRHKQHFQDIFSEQPSPLEIMFGHVCENPQEWEQRFERKNMNNGRYQGKVRWGNRNGDYGEHYWDINH